MERWFRFIWDWADSYRSEEEKLRSGVSQNIILPWIVYLHIQVLLLNSSGPTLAPGSSVLQLLKASELESIGLKAVKPAPVPLELQQAFAVAETQGKKITHIIIISIIRYIYIHVCILNSYHAGKLDRPGSPDGRSSGQWRVPEAPAEEGRRHLDQQSMRWPRLQPRLFHQQQPRQEPRQDRTTTTTKTTPKPASGRVYSL